MKHVFYICNHMVYLMAMKIIAMKKIPEPDVVFLYNRSRTNMAQTSIRGMEYPWFETTIPGDIRSILDTYLHIRTFRKLFRDADSSLEEAVENTPFELYLPHSGTVAPRILRSHPLCQKFYFIEEGTLTYAVTPENNFLSLSSKERFYLWLRSPLVRRRAKAYIKNSHYDYLHPKYGGCLCCNEDGFRGFPGRQCLGVPFRKLAECPDRLEALIVFDGGIVPPEQMKDSLTRMVRHIAREQKLPVAYFKFHPGQPEPERAKYRAFLSDLGGSEKLELRELSGEWIIEDLAYTCGDALSVYIICSSVGLYALGCGCRVFTTADHYRQGNMLLEKHYQTYGHVFSQYERI